MAIFNSYVKLPEANNLFQQITMLLQISSVYATSRCEKNNPKVYGNVQRGQMKASFGTSISMVLSGAL